MLTPAMDLEAVDEHPEPSSWQLGELVGVVRQLVGVRLAARTVHGANIGV